MTVPDCDSSRLALGALVLGALPPAEREQVENHVSGCERCRVELAELAPLPGMLNLTRPDDVASAAANDPHPSPRLLASLMVAAATEMPSNVTDLSEPTRTARGTRRSWLVSLGAAAVVVTAAIVWAVVMLTGSPDDTGPTELTASATDPATQVSATVELTPATGGTDIAVTLTGVPAGEECDLVVVDTAGDEDIAATWIASYDGPASVTGKVRFSTDAIERLDVTTDDGVLVTVPVP